MKISIPCDESFSRPVVDLDNLFLGCKALIDTGALFPVWSAPEKELISLGAKPDRTTPAGEISGFGGKAKGNIYKITLDVSGIYYIELPIIAVRLEMTRFHMVLPSTMFSNMKLSVDYKDHSIEIDTQSNQVSYHMHHQNNEDGCLVLVNG